MSKLRIGWSVLCLIVLLVLVIGGGGMMSNAQIQQPDSQSLNEGLVAYYPFNGNAIDESGHGNNGTVYGAALITDRFGNSNSAYFFDGVNDYIRVKNQSSIEPQNFTISAWIKLAKNSSGSILSMSIPPNGANNSGYLLQVGGDLRVIGYIYISNKWATIKGTTTLSLNQWFHLTFNYDHHLLKLYINGVKELEVAETTNINYYQHNPLVIGTYSTTQNGVWFNGSIDDLRIYNRALSEMEIQTLYESKSARPITISFDELNTPTSTTLPLSNQYQSVGVLFSMKNRNTGYSTPASAIRDGLWGNGAYSLPNSGKTGSNDYIVYATFVDPVTGAPAETNCVYAMVGDKSSESDNIVMKAYNIKGGLIGTSSYNSQGVGDFGVVCISVEGVHEITFYDESTSGADFDDFSFYKPTTPEIIPNPSFDNGIDGWHCIFNKDLNAQAEAVWDTTDYDTAGGSLKVLCTGKGNSYNAVQLFTGPFSIEKDKTYLLTFKAKSNAGFTIPYIKLNQGVTPWSDYATAYSNLSISTGWQNYAVIFKANTAAADGRLTFFLGTALPDGATFNIDSLSLKEIAVNPPPAGELLPNPGFDIGAGNWCCYSDASTQANGGLDALDYDRGPASYRIQCVNNGNTLNSIQLFTMPLNIVQNKVYQLTFKAKCDSGFAIPSIRLMKATSPWTNYAVPYFGFTITPEWQTYMITFTANTTASDGRTTFFLGNGLPDGATFHIDSLSLREME